MIKNGGPHGRNAYCRIVYAYREASLPGIIHVCAQLVDCFDRVGGLAVEAPFWRHKQLVAHRSCRLKTLGVQPHSVAVVSRLPAR